MTTQETTEETPEETAGGGLRKQLEAALAENKSMKADARDQAFVNAGIDTSTGLGKAISQVYEGDATKDAILKFAADEYGHMPEAAAPTTHPRAAEIALGNAQLDQVGMVADSDTRTTRAERLNTARAAGNYEQEGAIMAAQMQEMMDRQNRPQ